MVSAGTRIRLNQVRDNLAASLQAREEAIIAAYRAGGGMNEIANEVGMSYVGVARMLERLGVRERDGRGPQWVRGGQSD